MLFLDYRNKIESTGREEGDIMGVTWIVWNYPETKYGTKFPTFPEEKITGGDIWNGCFLQ